MNIVDMILRLLGSGDTISKIASMLGIGQEQVGKAVNAAVPTLLAGLAGVASKPGGGAELANTLANQGHGVLDNLSGLFSSGGATAAAQGSNLLGSVLGGGMTSQIASVLSRFTGVGEGATGKLLGLLTPVVMGVLWETVQGLGCRGHCQHACRAKEEHRASALPSGLGSVLSSAVPASAVSLTAPRAR